MTSPEERPANLVNVFSAFQAPPTPAAQGGWEKDEERAHEVMHRMENILIKELPRVADMVGGMMRGLEERLDEAHREITRLREAQQALERQHADDEARLSELETLRKENAEFVAKLEAVADLKRALSRL
jgi:chromosome segregation ATPase